MYTGTFNLFLFDVYRTMEQNVFTEHGIMNNNIISDE